MSPCLLLHELFGWVFFFLFFFLAAACKVTMLKLRNAVVCYLVLFGVVVQC